MNHDISHCMGNDCTLKELCYRYKAHVELVENKVLQYAYYIIPDSKGDDCNAFWKVD